MTTRPILFSAPMVRALLAGWKKQTRRLAKWKPREPGLNLAFSGLQAIPVVRGRPSDGRWELVSRGAMGCWNQRATLSTYAPGDLLWVKETWADGIDDTLYRADWGGGVSCSLVEKHGKLKPLFWRASLFLPRAKSRLTLRVTDVRVMRLQSISEADAIAEGSREPTVRELGGECAQAAWSERQVFARLWDHINGDRDSAAWADNPWVVALTFEVLRANIDTVLAQRQEVMA